MLRAVRLILPSFWLLALPVQAAVFTVTKTADSFDGVCDRDCSLREAVSAANLGVPTDDTDVVVIPAGVYQLTRLGAGEDFNSSGDLDVNRRMILVGAVTFSRSALLAAMPPPEVPAKLPETVLSRTASDKAAMPPPSWSERLDSTLLPSRDPQGMDVRVFVSGLTDIGVQVFVEDTRTGNTYQLSRVGGTPLQPVLDTEALPCLNP
ncbi:MAG TPA: CSLREA domain-containing protein [Thermoanaerobaculia bacterium]|nr:CSLREA domain-containing protein [Thermoanaerobaculia bacterium]